MKYISLKNHTDYTLLESVVKIEDYIKKAKKENLEVLSVTDVNLNSAIKMYNACRKENIDFVLGMDLYTYGLYREGEYKITAFAKGNEGYKELVKLTTLANSKYNTARAIIGIQDIFACKNLVILIGGLDSEIYECIRELDYANARSIIDTFKQKVSDFYLEIPCFENNKRNLEEYANIATEKEVDVVATNDVYYLEKEDSFLQKVVSAIKEGTYISKTKNDYKTQELYFKNLDEIKERLSIIPEEIATKAIENTVEIYKKCIFNMDMDEKKMPIVKLDVSEKDYLRELVFKGLNERYEKITDEILKRAEYELSVIDEMGFNGYFLIVKDIIDFAKKENILVGPGRGSAAGCLVSYSIGITNVDPIKYKLMFERFLNKGRKSLPDIDIDFETRKKDKVIQYVMAKYGEDHVCNIITYSKLKEKQLKRDLQKVLKWGENDRRLFNICKKLENNARHTSIHASGVIISRDSLIDEVPIIKDKASNINISQYQMEDLESMGLLKMDFLSLLNLDILAKLVEITNVKLENIELNDIKSFDVYNRGDTLGIFQAESYGITKLIKSFKIDKFLDISSVLALFRPGPLNSGLVDKVIETKTKNLKIEYEIEDLREILESTYGIIIYQEQVMEIAKKIAGFDLNESDDLRKAISKKKANILELYKTKFITSAVKRNYDRKKVENLYSYIEKFGEYGFNKSHTIPYAMLSYYTAYFKANYSIEFMLVQLNEHINNKDKLRLFINEAKKYNVEILGLDINKSESNFKIENNGIRYSLYAINEISKVLASDIQKEREKNGDFKDILDFVYRLLKYSLNKNQLITLAKSGCFDVFNITRKELIENVDEIFSLAKKAYEMDENIGISLFFTSNTEVIEYKVKSIPEYSDKIKYDMEYSVLSNLLSIKENEVLKYIKNEKVLVLDENRVLKNGEIVKFTVDKSRKYEYGIVKDKNIIYLDELYKIKNSVTNINIDELNEEEKEKLKSYIIRNGGFSKVVFYSNHKKLESKGPVFFDIKAEKILELSKLLKNKNLLIKV